MFGANLRMLMKENKITSRALSAKIGVSATYISYLLNGKQTPSLKMVESLADFFNVPISSLLSKKEPQPNNGLEALAKKYESVLLAMETMEPELVAELTSRIEAAASLFPRKDVSEKRSQDDASYWRRKKPG